MTVPITEFTNEALAALPSRTAVYFDPKTAGLSLFVTQAGSKQWWFSSIYRGDKRKQRLGYLESMAIEDARLAANNYTDFLTQGEVYATLH